MTTVVQTLTIRSIRSLKEFRLQASETIMADAPVTARRMLNEQQVLAIVPLGRSTLLRMEKEGKFPRSTYISPNRRIWYEDQIIGWQNAVDEFNPNRGRGKRRNRT